MTSISNAMALLMWDARTDAYNHVDLVNNWIKIGNHDHGAVGNQIPGEGIKDDVIEGRHVREVSLPGSKLVDRSIDLIKLSNALLASLCPLGVVLTWTQLDPSQAVPVGPGTLFEVPRGQTLSAGQHNVPGVPGSLLLPDYTDRFVFYVTTSSGTQVLGGANLLNLAHSHAQTPHVHQVDSHTHQVLTHVHHVINHQHGIPSEDFHEHTISQDGAHRHTWNDDNGGAKNLSSREVGDPATDGTRQSLYIPGFNAGGSSDSQPMNPAGTHSHTGVTGRSGAHSHGGWTGGMNGPVDTSGEAPLTTAVAPVARANAPVGTGGALGNIDNRPAFVTAIPIMRVRNP